MAHLFMRFPEGKKKALTLSYDDGVDQDIRLIEIMKANGLKGTFNINSGWYPEEGHVFPAGQVHRRMTKKTCQELYLPNGMEVAAHGLSHPFLEKLPVNNCTYEVMMDRMNLEQDFGVIVRGMAYPYGTYNDEVVKSLEACGIAYCRTVENTRSFPIPTDWLRLKATCHHSDPKLMEMAHDFVEHKVVRDPLLFYLWGHSYEFEQNDNWYIIEEFAEYTGNRGEIWYATNIEIYDYVEAYKKLVWSTDSKLVYNPTALPLYFEDRSQTIYCVKPGETLEVNIQ